MSARALWIVALGAALAALIALNIFRSEEPGSAGADTASSPSSATEHAPPHETVAAQRPVEASRGSPSADQRPLPSSGPYASISAALADHDVPPERRMQPFPELLETERRFAGEGVDPVWSTATEAGVLGRIAQIRGVAYAGLNVECRTTLCLLQFVESATPVPKSGIADVVELVKPEGLKPVSMIGIRVRGGAAVGIAYLQRVESAAAPTDGPEAR